MKRFLTILIIAVMVLPLFTFLGVQAEEYTMDSEGYDVYEIQAILKHFGYFTSECTGYYGEATSLAVKTFQTDTGLEATGVADDDTIAILRASNVSEATVTIRTHLNVREMPDAESEVIDSLTRNSKVYVYSQKDDWYHVETENGNLGFIRKRYLTPGEKQGLKGTVVGITDPLNVRQTPAIDGAVVTKIDVNQEVTVVGGLGDWFKIVVDGKTGYVFKKYISIGGEGGSSTTVDSLESWTGNVTASSLKIRSGPSTGYDTITTVKKGTVLEVTGISGDWYLVKLSNGTIGYASKSYVARGTGHTTCTINVSSTLNVRSGPGKSYSVVTTVKGGQVVTLLDNSDSWYKIKTSSGKEGYVDGQYVKLGGTLSAADTLAASKPSGTYKNGSNGNGVVAIQNRLKALGYFTGNVTGYYGSATTQAVKAFQSANGLSADGVCGTSTLNKMFSTSAKSKGSSSSGGSSNPPQTNVALGQQIADYAQKFLGVPYLLGANGPNSFDCSGFTKYVYRHFGIDIPRTAQTQGYWTKGTKIESASALQVGDLVFFNTIATDSDLCDHAGIYIGNGQVIHASSGSPRKVIISSMSSNYYRTTFSWGRRLI